MPQKRFRSQAKKKRDEKRKIASSIGQKACFVCAKAVELDESGRKPYVWRDHCRLSEDYEKGYFLALTCSDECRKVYFDGERQEAQ